MIIIIHFQNSLEIYQHINFFKSMLEVERKKFFYRYTYRYPKLRDRGRYLVTFCSR